MRTRYRSIEIIRSLWGSALLVFPRVVLGRIHRVRVDEKAVVVTRILGARHLTQAFLSGLRPSPEVIAAGTWVDGVHSLTALGLAVLDRQRARAALVDAVIAGVWGLFGAHDLSVGSTPPRHQRRLDMLAQAILPHLPGGRHVWVKAERVRRQHQSSETV